MKLLSIILNFLLLGLTIADNGIGTSYYIPTTNLLTEELIGGYPVFENLGLTCIGTSNDNGILTQKTTYSESTESFYRHVSTETNIKAELQTDFTMGATLDVTTGDISSGSNTVRGVTLHASSAVSTMTLSAKCHNTAPLSADLTSDFEILPEQIENPHLEDSWVDYNNFFTKYGSHVITDITYGSRIDQYCFSQESEGYNELSLRAKACFSFSRSSETRKGTFGACASISDTTINTYKDITVSTQLILRGGTLMTRTNLFSDPSVENFKAFFDAAINSQTPISYKFIPIWELLRIRYFTGEHYQLVNNLEAYYLGFLNFGCNYIDQPVPLQKFEFVNTEYQCLIAPAGCQTYTDCHWKVLFWCQCSGTTCIGHDEKTSDTGVKRQYAVSGSTYGGGGCKGSFTCFCENPNTKWYKTWSPNNSKIQPIRALLQSMRNM